MHYYQFNIADYRKDTIHLTPIEHYAYRQLLDQYYLSEQPITLDENALMRSLCVRIADDMQAVRNVLNDFFLKTDKGYIHKRCDVEIEAYHAKSKSASDNAKARWANKNKPLDADAMRPHSDGNANHKPLTINQELDKNIVGNKLPTCPHEDILKLYAQNLPMLAQVKVWSDKRKSLLRARWNEDEKRQNLQWWGKYFNYISKSDFLTGKKTSWQADIEWILNPTNLIKIIEGTYDNKETK